MKYELNLPFYLCMQYIRRGNKWTLALTIFLMAVAFINLIFISSLFNGIIKGSNQQIINTLTANIYLTPKDGQDYIANADELITKIEAVSGVDKASAQMVVPATLQYKNIKGNWQILAVDPDKTRQVINVADKMIDGSYLAPDDTDQIIIGRTIAGGEDVDENAFSFQGAKIGETVKISLYGQEKELKIKGIFYTKFMDADKRAFITKKTLDKIMPGFDDKTSTIVVKTTEKNQEDEVISAIKAEGIDANIYKWEEVAGLMKSVSQSFRSINFLMTIVGVLIAAVTIFIIIYVDIINKKKQIGILRAIGIKSYIIVFSYVILSAFFAVIGVVVGSLIFFFIVVPYFRSHPFVLPICDAVLVVNQADFVIRAEAIMWVSVASGLIPAIMIVRTKILNSILGK